MTSHLLWAPLPPVKQQEIFEPQVRNERERLIVAVLIPSANLFMNRFASNAGLKQTCKSCLLFFHLINSSTRIMHKSRDFLDSLQVNMNEKCWKIFTDLIN